MQSFLREKGIPTNVYYPIPVHLQKGYVNYGAKVGDLPTTEELTSRVLSLPVHTELTEEQLNFISSSIIEFLKA